MPRSCGSLPENLDAFALTSGDGKVFAVGTNAKKVASRALGVDSPMAMRAKWKFRSNEERTMMAKARLDGLYLLLLGGMILLMLGAILERASPAPMSDFKAVYYGARCVLQHSNPYQDGEILRMYEADGGRFPSDPTSSRSARRAILVCINLPTALFLVAPFAILSWGPAHVFWMVLMAGSLMLAAFLMWDLGAGYAPVVAGALTGFVLANSEVLAIIGNAAGIAISLCLIAVWCFIKKRFVAAGVVCLAISLALKPHDGGLLWLYYLLAGGVYRKRALQSLAVAVALCLPAILWVSQVAPHWMQELHSNLAATSARGDLNDPGPTSMGAHTLGMVISLQTIVSLFRDDASFYNPASYLIGGAPILVWVVVTLRSRFSIERAWLALAAIAALSLLPVYHRIYDSKLLLLTVPACAMLWSEGRWIGRIALMVNAAAFVLTGDLPWVLVFGLIGHLRPATPWLSGRVLTAIAVFPAPTILLVMSIFYLWVYVSRSTGPKHLDAIAPKIERIYAARVQHT